MLVKIRGYVNRYGHFRAANERSRPRDGEIEISAGITVDEAIFQKPRLTVTATIAAPEHRAEVVSATVEPTKQPRQKPREIATIPHHLTLAERAATEPVRKSDRTAWTGSELFWLMARNNITYPGMAQSLGTVEGEVRKWSKWENETLPLTHDQVRILNMMVTKEKSA